MKIGIDIHAIGSRLTGNETYIQNLVNALLRLDTPDYDYILYTSRKIHKPEWDFALRRIRPHTPFIRIPVSFPLALKTDKTDLALFQYVMPPVCPCPAAVMIHDISFEFYPQFFPPLQRARMRMLIPYSAKKAAHILTVSEFSKRQIAQTYGIDEAKITVTPNGVSDEFRPLQPSDYPQTLADRFGIMQKFILSVGNLQPRKNIRRLIQAYAGLRKKGSITHDLVLVGQKAFKGNAIEREIERCGVSSFVKTTGYVSQDELVALYNSADFFVYPSVYEGFGLPVIEAMACGTPVITSDCSSLPEVSGNAALLADPYSCDDMAGKITRLAHDESLKSELSRKGIERAQKFKWSETAEKTLGVFRKLM